MIVSVVGVNVIVVDIVDDKLVLVKLLGVVIMLNVNIIDDVVVVIKEVIKGGVYVLLDVLGYFVICVNLINCLCKFGKYIQVGLLLVEYVILLILMDYVVVNEL